MESENFKIIEETPQENSDFKDKERSKKNVLSECLQVGSENLPITNSQKRVLQLSKSESVKSNLNGFTKNLKDALQFSINNKPEVKIINKTDTSKILNGKSVERLSNISKPISYYHGYALTYVPVSSRKNYEALRYCNINLPPVPSTSVMMRDNCENYVLPKLEECHTIMEPISSSQEQSSEESYLKLGNIYETLELLKYMREKHFKDIEKSCIPRTIKSDIMPENIIIGYPTEEISFIQMRSYIPEFWFCKKSYIDFKKTSYYKLHTLASSSEIYRWTKSLINESASYLIDIEMIQRIENPYLLLMYELKKQELKKTQESIQELHLFHGTKSIFIDSICSNNFNFRVGNGISFTPLASIASQYCDKFFNGGGNKMILARVLMGTDNEAMGNNSKGVHGSLEVVKYEDNLFYPKYLITFRRKQRWH